MFLLVFFPSFSNCRSNCLGVAFFVFSEEPLTDGDDDDEE